MPDLEPTTSTEVNLALRAIIDHELRTFPIKDGMTIGSDPGCDIVVPGASPHHLKIRIWDSVPKLYSTDPEIKLRDGDGVSVIWRPLRRETMFVVGKTIFDCVRIYSMAPPPEEVELSLDRHACPRCRTNIEARDLSAKFCPHCGAPLPADCPEWPIVSTEQSPESIKQDRWWTGLMPLWLRERVGKDSLFFARRTTVLAYINTLFNLGLRHEAGVDHERQLPEAMRYYRRAARLGNLPARARLKVKEASGMVPSPGTPGEG